MNKDEPELYDLFGGSVNTVLPNKHPKSNSLKIPDYMFKQQFSAEKLWECMMDRISQYTSVNSRRVYVIFVNFSGLARILVVTQNNNIGSVGFPGGRLGVDISKCPAQRGEKHSPGLDNNCTACRFPVNFPLNRLNSCNERSFIWNRLKSWAEKYSNEIKNYCAEDETKAAVRIFKEETGTNFMTEEIISSGNVLKHKMTKFYICRGTFNLGRNLIPTTTNVKAVECLSFTEVKALIESGRMSNVHSMAFNSYQVNNI